MNKFNSKVLELFGPKTLIEKICFDESAEKIELDKLVKSVRKEMKIERLKKMVIERM